MIICALRTGSPGLECECNFWPSRRWYKWRHGSAQRQRKIKFILVGHEESAAFMASAYAKYTGKFGACLATSGPGAIHLLAGLYDAKADSAPVVAITGTTCSDMMGLILPTRCKFTPTIFRRCNL